MPGSPEGGLPPQKLVKVPKPTNTPQGEVPQEPPVVLKPLDPDHEIQAPHSSLGFRAKEGLIDDKAIYSTDDPIAAALAERRHQRETMSSVGPDFKKSPERVGLDYSPFETAPGVPSPAEALERLSEERKKQVINVARGIRELEALPARQRYAQTRLFTHEDAAGVLHTEVLTLGQFYDKFRELIYQDLGESPQEGWAKDYLEVEVDLTPVDHGERLELAHDISFSEYHYAKKWDAEIEELAKKLDPIQKKIAYLQAKAATPGLSERRKDDLDTMIDGYEAEISPDRETIESLQLALGALEGRVGAPLPAFEHDIEERLPIYMKEARIKGYIDDKELTRIFADLISSLRTNNRYKKDEAISAMQSLAIAARAKDEDSASSTDPLTQRVAFAATHYYEKAFEWFDKLEKRRGSFETIPPVDAFAPGEFNPRELKINFYEETHYDAPQGYYYKVYATTPEEFRIAAKSFIETARSGTFGRAWRGIYEKVEQFKTAFGQRREEVLVELRRLETPQEVIEAQGRELDEIRLQLEAQPFIYMDEYGINDYNTETSVQAKAALGEGNEAKKRWRSLVTLNDGQLMAALRIMDIDPRMRALFHPHGSRAEFMADHDIQNILQEKLMADLARRIMLVQLKDYLPGIDPITGRSKVAFNKNLRKVGNQQSDKDFRSLYEGFESDSWEKDNKFWDEEMYKAYVEEVRVKQGVVGEDGLSTYEKRVLKLADDPEFATRELAKAKSIVEFAFEIFGSTGEKAHRAAPNFMIKRMVGGREIIELIPIPEGQKFVQFMVTNTKKKYGDEWEMYNQQANDPALSDQQRREALVRRNRRSAYHRDKAVGIAITKAVNIFFKHGYSAVPFDPVPDTDNLENAFNIRDYDPSNPATFTQILIGVKQFNPDGSVQRHPDGKAVVTRQAATFDDVLTHPFGMWISHNYGDTQEEVRHQLLSPQVLAARDRILRGESVADEELWSTLATHALIIDPTRRIIRKLDVKTEVVDPATGHTKNLADQNVENIVTAAAFEGVYLDHYSINQALYGKAAALGKDYTEPRVYYGLQDYGGWNKIAMFPQAFFMSDINATTRRGQELLDALPVTWSGLPEQMAVRGVSGFFSLLTRPNEKFLSTVGEEIGNFSLARYANQTKAMARVMDTLMGFVDWQGFADIEGLLEKPYNQDFKLFKYLAKMKGYGTHTVDHLAEDEEGFIEGSIDSLGRYNNFNQAIVLFEVYRKAKRPLDLRDHDIWLDFEKGRIDPKILFDDNTGSSRHLLNIWHKRFMAYGMSTGPRGARAKYGDTQIFRNAWFRSKTSQELIGKAEVTRDPRHIVLRDQRGIR